MASLDLMRCQWVELDNSRTQRVATDQISTRTQCSGRADIFEERWTQLAKLVFHRAWYVLSPVDVNAKRRA